MNVCREKLSEHLPLLLNQENSPVLALIAEILAGLARGDAVSIRSLQSTPTGWDALLLMDEWRLVYPLGNSLTKAWEDMSQLLVSRKDLHLALPPWIEHLIRTICETGRFVILEILQSFFMREKDPAASRVSSFLIHMAHRTPRGVLDAGDINRLLREIPLGIPADTLIARLKNYGFISPHLRADFFRMRTPQYEIHPILVRAAVLEEKPKEEKTP